MGARRPWMSLGSLGPREGKGRSRAGAPLKAHTSWAGPLRAPVRDDWRLPGPRAHQGLWGARGKGPVGTLHWRSEREGWARAGSQPRTLHPSRTRASGTKCWWPRRRWAWPRCSRRPSAVRPAPGSRTASSHTAGLPKTQPPRPWRSPPTPPGAGTWGADGGGRGPSAVSRGSPSAVFRER